MKTLGKRPNAISASWARTSCFPKILASILALSFILPAPAIAQSVLDDWNLLKDEAEDPYLKFRRRKLIQFNELEECCWKVRYQNKIYDLSPLTRKGLERPLESDIRTVFRQVPGAAMEIKQIDQNNRDEKAHTAFGTIGLGAFLLTRIFQSRSQNQKSDKYTTLNIISLLVFAKAVHANWSLKRATNERIATAVEEFNAMSPDKIVLHKDTVDEGGKKNAKTYGY